MKDTKLHISISKDIDIKNVCIYINDQTVVLRGNWYWEMECDAIFCSNVIISFPQDFNGTKGIIHPEDVELIKSKIVNIQAGTNCDLSFRLITTYGQIRLVSGKNVGLSETPILQFCAYYSDLEEKTLEVKRWTDHNEQLLAETHAYKLSEDILEAGIWYHNTSTGKTFYSDGVFRIYGLPPQSLNAHLNTFNSYIHAQDKVTVEEAFDSAYARQAPLQLQYRIMLDNEELKHIQIICKWAFNSKGERILNGVIQNITSYHYLDEQFQQAQNKAAFNEKLLIFNEQTYNIGTWQLNLLTRKITYSDNCFRLFGIKQQSGAENLNWFTKLVHPDDQSMVEEMYHKMILQHQGPDIEYRIIKPNGRTAWIQQKGRPFEFYNEMVIAGTMQDVSSGKYLTDQVAESNRQAAITNVALQTTERISGVAHWLWHLESGEIIWGDNFSDFLGCKANTSDLTLKLLNTFIHPDDRALFNQHINTLLKTRLEDEFMIRVIRKGETKYIRSSFKIVEYENESYFIAVMQDITQSYQLQKDAHDQVQFKHLLSDALYDGLLVTDISYRILEWNKRCEEFFGKTKDEVLLQNFFDIFPSLRHEGVFNDLKKVLGGEAVDLKNYASVFSKHIWNIYLVPMRDNTGEVVGIIHIVRDVTKESILQKELTERLSFIEKLLESTVDRIVVLNSHMNIVFWNKKAEEYYGLSGSHVIGKNTLEVFPGLRQTPSYIEFKRALKGETIHIPVEEGVIAGNYQEVFLIPIKNDNNTISAVLWVMHDVTKDYQLKQQQAKADMILNTIDEGFYELDDKLCFQYVNAKCEQLWKMDKKDILGKYLWDVFPQAVDTPASFAIQYAMEERAVIRREFFSPIIHRPIITTMVPSPTGLIVFFREVHEITPAE